MYSSNSYSQTRFGLEARDIHKHKGKSCGYYMRIIFFFSSLIQSLIIMSLVLFLVYGQPEKSAEEKRVEDLEQSLNRISQNNINLRKAKADLEATLGARTAEKTSLQKQLAVLNTSVDHNKKLCETEKQRIQMIRSTPVKCATNHVPNPICPVTPNSEVKALKILTDEQAAMIQLIQANFTQTTHYIRIEKDNAIKDRDAHHLQSISLRRENTNLKEQLTLYTKKCKEDFAKSLEGIQTVTSSFLARIEKLFPHSMTFHLTCVKQSEQMELIRNSCSSLSKEVEEKFQRYLDNVGMKVSDIQALSSRLEVQNSHLTVDIQQCQHNRSAAAMEAGRLLLGMQENHDKQMETLLKEKTLLGTRLGLKEAELSTLKERVQSLTTSAGNCNTKQAASPKPAGLTGPAKGTQSVG